MKLKPKLKLLVLTAIIMTLSSCTYDEIYFCINWNSIEIGDSKSEVLSKLGEPRKESTEFDFWVMNPHKENAKKAGSEFYLTWLKGIDTVYVIGFDHQSNVVYKVYGGS